MIQVVGTDVMDDIKLVLIGGTSHVGKSTLGQRLAQHREWDCLSTDQFARHPGRPWRIRQRPVPQDVVEHYSNLSVAELVDSVLFHYRHNVWPIIDAVILSRLQNPFDRGLVLEGSAILPDLVEASVECSRVRATWLTAPKQLIRERVLSDSGYDRRTLAEQHLIDAFLGRTIEFDRLITNATATNRKVRLDVSSPDPYETLRSIA